MPVWMLRFIARFVWPELKLVPHTLHRAVIASVYSRSRSARYHRVVETLFAITWVLSGMLFVRWYEPYALRRFVPTAVSFVAFFGVGFLLLLTAANLILVPSQRRILRRLLRSHYGATLCEQCGYDLRGQLSGKCSECGSEVQ